MRVRGDNGPKARNKFIWHSCKYCKRAFPSKFEVIKHKREKHAMEMKISTQSTIATDSDDDEPTVVIVTKVKDDCESGDTTSKDSLGATDITSSSSPCSSNLFIKLPESCSSSPPTLIEYEVQPTNKSQQNSHHNLCTNFNDKSKQNSSSPPMYSHHMDTTCHDRTSISPLLIRTQPHSLKNESTVAQAFEHSSSSSSAQQKVLYQFFNENNNNSYRCRTKNKHKFSSGNLQQEQGQQKRQRQRQNSLETSLHCSSTTSSPSLILPSGSVNVGNGSRRLAPTLIGNNVMSIEKVRTSSSINSSNTKSLSPSTAPSTSNNSKVLRRLLNGYWDPPKLKEYQRPSVITSRHLPSKVQPSSPQKNVQSQKKSLSCLICRIPFLEKESLAKHLDSHLSSPSIPDFQCQICTKPFDKRESYEAHMEASACRTNFLCPYCFLHFPNVQQLKYHETTNHTGRTPYSCKFCFLPFETVGSLMAHLVTHTITESEEC